MLRVYFSRPIYWYFLRCCFGLRSFTVVLNLIEYEYVAIIRFAAVMDIQTENDRQNTYLFMRSICLVWLCPKSKVSVDLSTDINSKQMSSKSQLSMEVIWSFQFILEQPETNIMMAFFFLNRIVGFWKLNTCFDKHIYCDFELGSYCYFWISLFMSLSDTTDYSCNGHVTNAILCFLYLQFVALFFVIVVFAFIF